MYSKAILWRRTCLFTLVVMCIITGCAWLKDYGSLKVASGGKDKVTVEYLMKNSDSYYVFYAGLSIENPSAVLFQPKREDQRLELNKWIPINSKEDLNTVMEWIRANVNYPPILWEVLGPDKRCYGYMYSSWDHVVIKSIDQNTLWIDDIPLPEIDYSGSGMGVR